MNTGWSKNGTIGLYA